MSFNTPEDRSTTALPADGTPASTPQQANADEGLNGDIPPDLMMALARLPNELQRLQYELWLRTAGSIEARSLQERAIMTMALQQQPNRASTASSGPLDRALMRHIAPIPPYQGWTRDDAALHWLRDCEEYFARVVQLSAQSMTDDQKIMAASNALTKKALIRWRTFRDGTEAGRGEPVHTWKDFRQWTLQQFGERLGEQSRYDRFQDEMQGRSRFEIFSTRLQDLANMVTEPIPESVIRLRLINGSRPELKAKWLQERDPPKNLADTIDRFCQLERGVTLARETLDQHDPDAMEISAINNPRIEQSPPSNATRTCFKCNRPGHFKRECPELNSRNRTGSNRTDKAQGKVMGR